MGNIFNPLDEIISQESYDRIIKCINNLSNIYKKALKLKYLHNYTNYEISNLLNITIYNVNSRIYRGKKKLNELLELEKAATSNSATASASPIASGKA